MARTNKTPRAPVAVPVPLPDDHRAQHGVAGLVRRAPVVVGVDVERPRGMVRRHAVGVRRPPAGMEGFEHVVLPDRVEVAPVPVHRRGVGMAHRAAGPRAVFVRLRTEVVDHSELECVPGIHIKGRTGERRVVRPDDEGHAVGE